MVCGEGGVKSYRGIHRSCSERVGMYYEVMIKKLYGKIVSHVEERQRTNTGKGVRAGILAWHS